MEENEEITQGYQRVRKTPVSFIYDIDYAEAVDHPHNYLEDYNVFRNASANDIIKLHINSIGGYLHTLCQLINNLRSSEATIVTVLEGEALSAAGALFLQGQHCVVGDNATMLIHEPTGGYYDSHNKVKRHHEFTIEHTKTLMYDYYEGFLTVEEIDKVLEGQDMWLSTEEILTRLEAKAKYFEEKEKNS